MSNTTGCRLVLFVGAIACLLLITTMVAIEISKQRAAAQSRLQWVAERKQWLLSGKADHLYFYDMDDTDALLAEFAGMREITKLEFVMTDVTDDGVTAIVELPNLEVLKLESVPVGDKGLAMLSACDKLKTLTLLNTMVTDQGLRALRDMASLTHLTIYCGTRQTPSLTDKAVSELRSLHNLEQFDIGGGWMNKAAAAKLREALPNCRITVDGQE